MSGFCARSAAFFIAVFTVSLFCMLPEAALNGQCSTETGVCIEQDSCTTSGGSPKSGLCPDDRRSVKCCQKASCSTGGSCMWSKDCKSGNTDPGFCPGPSTFICCLPPTTTPTLCSEQILLRSFIPADAFLMVPEASLVLDRTPGLVGAFLRKYMPAHIAATICGGGNNRTFCHDCGDSKADLSASIKIDPFKGQVDLSAAVPGDGVFGPTKIYWPWDVRHNPSEPWWFGHISPGAQPIWDETMPRTLENLYVASSKLTTKGGVLNFIIAAEAELVPHKFPDVSLPDLSIGPIPIPYPPGISKAADLYEMFVAAYEAVFGNRNINFVPDINANISVSVVVDPSGTITYTVGGTHDAFPSYELYVGDELVYSWDAVAQGAYLWDLASGASFRGIGFELNQISATGSLTKSLATVASGRCGDPKP